MSQKFPGNFPPCLPGPSFRMSSAKIQWFHSWSIFCGFFPPPAGGEKNPQKVDPNWIVEKKLRKNPQKKMKTRENTQNRVQPPKTSPIEQITDRWEPKNSPLQRVTLQCLTSCYRWSNLLRDNVSNLALASAQNPPKIWKYAWNRLIFLLWFFTFWPPFDIVRLHPIAAKTWACDCTLLKLEVCLESQQNDQRKNAKLWKTRPKFPGL